jgi:hypothetical protein
MIFYLIIVLEFVIIMLMAHRFKKIKAYKISRPCGQCVKEAAYERLCERRKILGEAYRQYEELPKVLYASSRKQEIAKTACQHFYANLRNIFGQM